MANKHGDFIWYELMTSEPDAAQSFYGPLLGWSFADSGQPEIDYRVFTASDGEGVGGVMKMPDGAPMPPCWMGYVCVDDVDACAERIKSAGGAVCMAPQDIPGVGRFAFVADPQGVMFYIMKGAVDGTSTAFAEFAPKEGHCAWNELSTTDQQAAKAFYGREFGWKVDGAMDLGPMGKYEFLRAGKDGGGVLGALMTKTKEQPMPCWTYYFRVPDIDTAVEYLNEEGGRIINGPQEIPGGQFVLNALDPQGAAFALIGKRR